MLTPYRLSVVAAITSPCLTGGVAYILIVSEPGSSPQRAAPLLAFLAPTIVALLALLRSERNAFDMGRMSTKMDALTSIASYNASTAASAAHASEAAAKAGESAASAVEIARQIVHEYGLDR